MNIKTESVAVWLIVKDGLNAGMVLLQQRAETEIENGIEIPQSNPYICQPSWNEKLEPGESLMDAVIRGAKEELGEEFQKYFNPYELIMFSVSPYTYKGKPAIGYNYVGLISSGQLEKVKLHKGARNQVFKTVCKSDHIVSLGEVHCSKYPKEVKDERSTVVLFPDQHNALQSLFSLKKILAILQ
ncbi:MAG: NUDIX hydrolase [Candidatus Parcubacteria bacterium]|nr:NUDIX hydrolase [Candidatus Parcubacteria bacterium]